MPARITPALFRASVSNIPVIERDGSAAYVRLADIPEPQRAAFRIALRGSCCPLIEGAGDCAWASDWIDWLAGRFPRW